MDELEMIPFKTINLIEVLGDDEFKSLGGTDDYEKLCRQLFGLDKTENHDKNRGDFKRSGIYWDHKNCKVVPKNMNSSTDYFIKVKYSNVVAKIWVQYALRELDEIIKHQPNDYRLVLMRYKTEITFDDMCYVNYVLERLKSIVKETNSYCLNNGMDYMDFCNDLSYYNISKYSNLILIHDRAPFDYTNIHKYKTETIGDVEHVTTPKKGVQYLLTPIDIKRAYTHVDYIGFGGFKVVVSKYERKKEFKKLECLNELYDEIDLVIELIHHQNEIISENSSYNMLYKMTKDNGYLYNIKDRWDFSEFKKQETLTS